MLRLAFTEIFISILSSAFSQHTAKLIQIDSLVSIINASSFHVQRDSVVQDHPECGLKMTTHLSLVVNDAELIKYINHVNVTRTENGVTQKMVSSSTFYFDYNKSIKVEEYLVENEKKKAVNRYCSNDKPLYSTSKWDHS